MAKKPVKTFHPLAMAKSLEAQNEAVGLALAKLETIAQLQKIGKLAGEVKKLAAEEDD